MEKCPNCGGEMIPLVFNSVCKAECDLVRDPGVTEKVYLPTYRCFAKWVTRLKKSNGGKRH